MGITEKTFMSEFGIAEADVPCPVSLDTLGQMYRADPASVADMVRDMSEDRRARLAFFCYGRAHLRDLSLIIAASCDEDRLAQLAGAMGAVLAKQARAKIAKFGKDWGDRASSRPKVSLGGMRRV